MPARRRRLSHVPIAVPLELSAEVLGESDDDALGAAQEAEAVAVLVLGDLADELATVAAQTRDDVVDVVDGEHDAADAERVRGAVAGSTLTAGGVWNLDSSTRP